MSLPATMRAIGITRYGDEDVLERQVLPLPEPGPDDVLIRVVAAGINFMDVHTRQGKYETSTTYPVRLPTTLGVEGAGEVVAVGSNVERIAAGDRVAWCLSWGSYAEYAVVPARLVATIPAALDFPVAATAMFPGCTANYLINDTGRITAGMTCLIFGASGGIGALLVQLGKAAGATVIAVTSSAERAARVLGLGADHVLLQDAGVADAVRAITAGRGADVVYDAIGRATLRESLRATRTRGLVVNYGSVSGGIQLDPIELGEAGSLFLTRPRLGDHLQDADTVQRRADAIFGGLLDGTLTIPRGETFTFDTVEVAHRALEERTSTGKAVLAIGTPSVAPLG